MRLTFLKLRVWWCSQMLKEASRMSREHYNIAKNNLIDAINRVEEASK